MILGAQVANELLNITEIKSNLCIHRNDNDKIYISARSIDEVNVQVIMEKLGGGWTSQRCRNPAREYNNSGCYHKIEDNIDEDA